MPKSGGDDVPIKSGGDDVSVKNDGDDVPITKVTEMTYHEK